MKFIGAIIFLALLALGVFLVANWGTLGTPVQLSFVFFEAKGSVGWILLSVVQVFALLLVSYTLVLRTAMLMDARRHARELQAQRKLVDSAESSRLDQLREQISSEFALLHAENKDVRTSLTLRGELMEKSLRKALDEATNSVSAHLGEVEEKLDRVLPRSAG